MALAALLLINLIAATQAQSTDTSSNIFTTNDGVSIEKFVSYLKMDGTRGATIRLDNQKLNQNLDYTVMVWFKPMSDSWRSRYQYAFSFTGSLECYFTASAQLSCQSDQMIDKLTNDVSNVQQNQWTHITLSGGQKNGSYLLLEQNLAGQISYDNKSYLILQQKAVNWSLCLGSCVSDYAFIGGFRELVVLNQYISQAQASRLRNHYLLWDNSILAYFRFSARSMLKDEVKRNSITPTQSLTFGRDYIPNDVCQPILSYYQFLQFSASVPQILTTAIDGRWVPQDQNWAYSVSLRIKINSISCTQSSPSLAQTGCFFIHLRQAFMLFMPAPNQVAAYFFGEKVYMDYQTRSIFVPEDQWVNIQFTASQYYGYDLRAYDIYGRLMNNATEARSLSSQDVKIKELTLFRGVQAIVKDLRIYTSRETLPIDLPDDQDSMNPQIENSTNCLAYFTFLPSSINTVNRTKFINYCSSQKFSVMNGLININQTFQIAPDYWVDSPYNSSKKTGLITSNIGLFDGIACQDQSLYPKTRSTTSYIKSNVQMINSNMPIVTVEFWFKADGNQTQYLSTLWARNRSLEFFSVFYDSTKVLLCAPFGITSIRSPYVSYPDYTEANRQSKGWFHLTCQYEQQNQVIGYLFAQGIEASSNVSLTGVNTVLANDTYEIYLGNNKSQIQGTPQLFIREYRLWAIKRSLQDIKEWRQRQIDPRNFPQTALYGYLRLSEGGYSDTNFIFMINPNLTDYSVFYSDIQYQSDDKLTICPINTYLSSDGKCFQNPVQYLMGAIYPDYNFTSGNLNWLFSSNETIVLTPNQTSQMQVNWVFEDQYVSYIASANNQRSLQNMKLSSNSFRDQSYYKMRLNYSNADLTYLELYSMTFVPNSCQFYLISNTNNFSDYLNYTDPQSQKDIVITFALVQRKSYCNEVTFFNKVDSVTYQTSPPIEQKPNIIYSFDNSTGLITVTIPKAEQFKIPLYKDIKFIFRLQWTNSQLQGQVQTTASQLTFQNLLYTIRMNTVGQAVLVSLVANSSTVLVGESLYLNASGTQITYSTPDDYTRLSYQWSCPANYCANLTSSELVITPQAFAAFNVTYGTSVTFTVNVTYAKRNNSGSISVQEKVSVTWQFINSTSNIITSPSVIATTNDNQQFSVVFSRFNASQLPSNISVAWSIVPNITKSTYSQSNTILTIAKGGLSQMTTYTMTVTVTNTTSPSLTARSSQLTFTTSQPPQGGTANVSPTSGFINVTNFTIQIVNWQSSNKPIKYRVWSTTSATGTTAKNQLNDWTLDSQPYRFIAQDPYPYIVEITDNSQELTSVKVSPNVTVQPTSNNSSNSSNSTNSTNTTWDVKLNSILLLQPSLKFQQLAAFASDDLATADSSTRTSSNAQIVDSIGQDVNNIGSNSQDDQRNIAKGSVQVLSIILQNPDDMSTDYVQQSLNIVKQIQNYDPAAYKQLKKDSSFKVYLASIASGVMKFTKKIFGLGRMLQQDEISQINEQARQLKDNLLQELCEDAVANSYQQQIMTSSFDLIVQKFTIDSAIPFAPFYSLDESDGYQGLYFQINQIANSLQQLTQSIMDDSFCVETTFYKFNPQQTKSNVLTQYSSSIFEYKLSDDSGVQEYQGSIYNPSQTVVLNFYLNPETYKSNQSVCMAYSSSSGDWSDSPCFTDLDVDRSIIQCKCNMIDTLYYGVFTDQSRQEGDPIVFPTYNQYQNETNPPTNEMIPYTKQDSLEVDHSFAFLAVVLTLITFTVFVPSIVIYLDKRDHKLAKEGTKSSDRQVHSIIMRLAKTSEMPYSYWLMRQDDIISYTMQSKSIMSHFFEKLHPFAGLFSKFDILEARIWRFALYLLQISIFSIICVTAFGENYRSQDLDRTSESMLDQLDIGQAIIIGVFGTIMLLPLPFSKALLQNKLNLNSNRKLRYLPDAMVAITQENQTMNNQQFSNHSVYNNNSNEAMHSRGGMDLIDQNAKQAAEFTIQKRCQPLKYIILVVSYILALLVIVLCFLNSTKMPVANQYCFVASFYIGFFGSLLLTNVLRVLINAILIDRKPSKCVQYLFISSEAIQIHKEREMVKQALIELQLQETQSFSMRNNASNATQNNINNTHKQFKKDYVSSTLKAEEYGDNLYDSGVESKLNRSKTETAEDLPSIFKTNQTPDSSQRLDRGSDINKQMIKVSPQSPVATYSNLRKSADKLRSPSLDSKRQSLSSSKYQQIQEIPKINANVDAVDTIVFEDDDHQE